MNYLTLYLVDFKAQEWAECGVHYSWGSVDVEVDGGIYYVPNSMNPTTSVLVVMDDERKKCRIRRGDRWVSPICADFDNFISIIENQKEILN